MYHRILAWIILFTMALFAPFAIQAAKADVLADYVKANCIAGCVDPDVLQMAAEAAARTYDVDPRLLVAIAKKESGFRPKARNGSQTGLNQIHLRYHRAKFEGASPYDVFANLRVSAEIISECKSKNRNVLGVLKCYNGGGTVGYPQATMVAYREVKKLKVHWS